MKHSSLLFTFLFSALLWFSCKDKCKDINCNSGWCDEGICQCDDGWMGEFCETRRSETFAGTWRGPFSCINQQDEVILVVDDDPVDLRKITMNTLGLSLNFNGLNFGLDGNKLHGVINENYTAFKIDTQKLVIPIPNTPGVSADVFGDGILTGENTLTLLINIENSDFNAFFTCSGTLTK